MLTIHGFCEPHAFRQGSGMHDGRQLVGERGQRSPATTNHMTTGMRLDEKGPAACSPSNAQPKLKQGGGRQAAPAFSRSCCIGPCRAAVR